MIKQDRDLNTWIESNRVLLLIAFIEGGAVMAVELLGAKMIAPYFGSSLSVWSSVLAITLLGLTCGYYAGGILSRKPSAGSNLQLLLLIAALLTALMPILGAGIMEYILFMDSKIGSSSASI